LAHNIAIKSYCDKKIISSSKYCNDISKCYFFLFFPLTKINIFNSHSEKKYWLKNIFASLNLFITISFYLFIAILRAKILCVNRALEEYKLNFKYYKILFKNQCTMVVCQIWGFLRVMKNPRRFSRHNTLSCCIIRSYEL